MRIFLYGTICLALLLLPATDSSAQTEAIPRKTGTGSINGRVTVGGKPRAGVTVLLESAQTNTSGGRRAIATTETDEEGNYSLRDIKPDSYRVAAIASDTVPQADPMGPVGTVLLGEGETLDGINLSLVKGGVITGTVVDSNGWPVTGQLVKLDKFDPRGVARSFYGIGGRSIRANTDDRGVYRLYGLPPGKYLVSLGEAGGDQLRSGKGPPAYSRVYHHDTADQSKATPIEVSEETEATGIDIKLSARLKAYTVSGRVIATDTQQAVPGVKVGYTGRMAGAYIDGPPTSATGEFRFEGLSNGRYSFYLSLDGESELYSELVSVEVSDGDVTGVEIPAKRGSSISGVVIIEGTRDSSILSRVSKLSLGARRHDDGTATPPPLSRSVVAQDGRFRINGLQPGTFSLHPYQSADFGSLKHTRTEREGVLQNRGIEVGPRAQVTGVRLVLTYASGSIYGQLVAEDMKAADGAAFMILARSLDQNAPLASSAVRSDVRGGFLIQPLVAGQYELVVTRLAPSPSPAQGTQGNGPVARQSVTVINGQRTNVTIKLNPVER